MRFIYALRCMAGYMAIMAAVLVFGEGMMADMHGHITPTHWIVEMIFLSFIGIALLQNWLKPKK